MRFAFRAPVLALAGALVLAGAPAAAADSDVVAVVHLPLAVDRGGGVRELPAALLQRYVEVLGRLGPVTTALGPGSWVDGSVPVIEADAHLTVRTTDAAARRALPPLLHRMCVELHQHETLAEIVALGPPAVPWPDLRVRIVVPWTAGAVPVLRAHEVMERYAGGASETDTRDGAVIAASLPKAEAAALVRALRAYAPTLRPSRLVTDDCHSSRKSPY